MKNRFVLISVCILFVLTTINVQAQHNFTLYGMPGLGQAHYENPAFSPHGKVYVGLALSNHTFGINHSGFRLNQVLQSRSQDDSLQVSPDGLKNAVAKNNFLMTEIRNEIFGLGIKVGKNYFSLSATHRLSMAFQYPGDLMTLIAEGNGGSLLGERISMDGLGFHLDGYMEYALGYNRQIGQKWTVGARLKFLSGYANFTTQKSKLGITTDEETFDLTTDGQFKFSAAGFGSAIDSSANEEFDATDLLSNFYDFKNFGLALDLGATYDFTDQIRFNASVLDVGFIQWKENTVNYETNDLSFRFEGVDAKEFFKDSTDYFDNLSDSLMSYVDNDLTNEAYSTMFNTRFYIGATYQPFNWLTVGATSYNHILGKRLRMSAILSGSIHLGEWLSFTANYSVYGRSFGNVGLGLALRGGPIQFYVATDNILAIHYMGSKNAHISFGLNVLVGKKNKKIKEKKSKASFE